MFTKLPIKTILTTEKINNNSRDVTKRKKTARNRGKIYIATKKRVITDPKNENKTSEEWHHWIELHTAALIHPLHSHWMMSK